MSSINRLIACQTSFFVHNPGKIKCARKIERLFLFIKIGIRNVQRQNSFVFDLSISGNNTFPERIKSIEKTNRFITALIISFMFPTANGQVNPFLINGNNS